MIDLSSPDAWKRPFKNARKLLFGNGIKAVLSLGYLGLVTRALGVDGFGVLTLIVSTVALVSSLASFQPGQFVLRYGARAIANNNPSHLIKLIRFSVLLEFLSASVALVAIWLLVDPILSLFGIAPQYAHLMERYALILPLTTLGGVALGTIQLTDRYDLISRQLTISPIVKFCGAVLLFFLGGGVAEFLALWALSKLLGVLVLIIFAWRNLKDYMRGFRRASAAGAEACPVPKGRFGSPEAGAWQFLWGTHFSGSLGVDLVPMLVASVLGPEGAGLIRVAQRIATIVLQPTQKLIAPALMTDMTWLNAVGTNKQRRRMVLRTGGVTMGFTLVVSTILIIFGKQAIILMAGVNFLPAYGALVYLTLAMAIGTFNMTLLPLVQTAGKVWSLSFFQLGSLILFALYLPFIVEHLGITGAGVSFLLYVITGASFLSLLSWPLVRKQRTN